MDVLEYKGRIYEPVVERQHHEMLFTRQTKKERRKYRERNDLKNVKILIRRLSSPAVIHPLK